MKAKEREFNTLEGRKIYKIQNISKELKNDISESNTMKAVTSALYTYGVLCSCAAIASILKDGMSGSFITQASFGLLGTFTGVITNKSYTKSNELVKDGFNNLKNEIKVQKDIFTSNEKVKINKLKKSIDKIKSNSEMIAVLEGIFFSFGTYFTALCLSMARNNDELKTPACLMALFYYLVDAGLVVINREQNNNIKRNINSLEDEISKPYTLIKK